MDHPVISPKKLIEVALPLDAINAAAAREKSLRHGHPSTLHLWWARRPLAAARAVIFAQLVNDPSWKWEIEHPGEVPPNNLKASWAKSRKRLFAILQDLVVWENTNNEAVLNKARDEIRKSWKETCELNANHPHAAELFNPDKIPGFRDPFAGGGSIPLEAQRLGLETLATDLNPVAVLINKAMIEIPPMFTGRPPVNKDSRNGRLEPVAEWPNATGLASDIRYYGRWLRDQSQNRIGHLYPKIEITSELAKDRSDLVPLVGQSLPVIAWIWARTVKSPNPAFSHVDVPLVSTFSLSAKPGQAAYVQPVIEADKYYFDVKVGNPSAELVSGTKVGRGASFRCLLSGTPIAQEHIRSEFKAKRSGMRLMAIIAGGERQRVYLPPFESHSELADSAHPLWQPEQGMNEKCKDLLSGRGYGFKYWHELFTQRQLVALTTLSDLVHDARLAIRKDAVAAGLADDNVPLEKGGTGATAYADAVSVYLAFAVDKVSEGSTSLCTWSPLPTKLHVVSTFGRQALPMVWDFAEANIFANSSGNILRMTELVANVVETQCSGKGGLGHCLQADASRLVSDAPIVISTDPPYYDNIGYADLSDFFYVWLRRALRDVFPSLLGTISTPKEDELIAATHRHETSEAAEKFFLAGMKKVMARFATVSHPTFPITIYYAFRQSESTDEAGTTSSGWETFLQAIVYAGLSVLGTWPMRTERSGGFRNNNQNALASSIVLVCRARPKDAPTISRRAFIRELNQVLPDALDEMTRGGGEEISPVAPVDLSQAIIGPGMAVFSKYAAVLEADGSPMSVRTALQLINRFLAEDDFDADTQFCLHWFEQHGWEAGKFGEADTLARAKGTSVDGVKQAGVIHAFGGSVRLLKWAEYTNEWDPQSDQRLPIWEVLHQLIRIFNTDGEIGAAAVFAAVQSKAEAARQLAYRLYTLCERKNWAEDARAYNEVVTSWSGIEAAASKEPSLIQRELFDN